MHFSPGHIRGSVKRADSGSRVCCGVESAQPHVTVTALEGFPSCHTPCSHASRQALPSSSGREGLGPAGMFPALTLEFLLAVGLCVCLNKDSYVFSLGQGK